MNSFNILIPLILGFILDTFIGDPYSWPHPIKLFGNIISYLEKHLNKGKNRILKGAFVAIGLILTTALLLWLMMHLLLPIPYLYYPFATIMVFYGLANRSLIHEVLLVNTKLNSEGLEAGRRQLSFIVGRDTATLSANKIRTSTLETLSENLSDGVIAPLFYYALGGVPLMFAYKMANTLDSMIGYKSPRYKEFGLFGAKIDDLLNLIPARLTAFLMIIISGSWRGLMFIFKYGHKHSSPNSGYPESALAGILNCCFGGPNSYHGQVIEKPYIGSNERDITLNDIKKGCRINFRVSVLMVLIIVTAYLFLCNSQ